MKKRNLLLFLSVSFVACMIFSSCGSSWNIQGNNLIIHKAENDTIVPAGTYYFVPDSLK